MLIFSNSFWLCIMCATAPNQPVPPDFFFGQQAIKEAKYGLAKYPQVMKPSVTFSYCLNDGDVYHPADGFFAVKSVIYPSRSGMKAARLRVGQTFIWARLDRL